MKKKIGFLAAGVFIAAISMQAQFKKGDRMVGASVASVVVNSGTADIAVAQIGSNTSKITGFNVSINPKSGLVYNR